MTKVFLTGGSGFIGIPLLHRLCSDGYDVTAPVRRLIVDSNSHARTPLIDDIGDLSRVLQMIGPVDIVVHVAAKAHTVNCSLQEFLAINTKATIDLARAAADVGVKRFIFLSSIGVNGVFSTLPFSVSDLPNPTENYAISKFEAENALKRIGQETGMEIVIIRPPLVYGANAPGNFGKLINLVKSNFPLPLGAIFNKRSLVALPNLVDLVLTCLDHPKAANQTFLVSDDRDISTTELLKLLTMAAGKTPRLIPVPVNCLRLLGKLTGKGGVIDRLCGNLQLDITHTKQVLNWKPPMTMEEGIKLCFEKEDIC